MRETVKRELSENNRVVLNLGEVSYIDSGGIGTMVSLFTTARNAGGDIKLANLTKRGYDNVAQRKRLIRTILGISLNLLARLVE